MGNLKFNPRDDVIVVEAFIKARLSSIARLVVDTGATNVVMSGWLIKSTGLIIDPKSVGWMTTASRVEKVYKVKIPEIRVLDKIAKNVECRVMDLPPQSGVDGLLGLSFLKHFKLTIDFKKGWLSLD